MQPRLAPPPTILQVCLCHLTAAAAATTAALVRVVVPGASSLHAAHPPLLLMPLPAAAAVACPAAYAKPPRQLLQAHTLPPWLAAATAPPLLRTASVRRLFRSPVAVQTLPLIQLPPPLFPHTGLGNPSASAAPKTFIFREGDRAYALGVLTRLLQMPLLRQRPSRSSSPCPGPCLCLWPLHLPLYRAACPAPAARGRRTPAHSR